MTETRRYRADRVTPASEFVAIGRYVIQRFDSPETCPNDHTAAVDYFLSGNDSVILDYFSFPEVQMQRARDLADRHLAHPKALAVNAVYDRAARDAAHGPALSENNAFDRARKAAALSKQILLNATLLPTRGVAIARPQTPAERERYGNTLIQPVADTNLESVSVDETSVQPSAGVQSSVMAGVMELDQRLSA